MKKFLMRNFLIRFLFISLIGNYFYQGQNLKAFIPDYYLPSSKNLEKESLSIGKTAYQLLYFGQIKESLEMAKLAVKINKSDEKLWTILAETQIANDLFNEALFSLDEAEAINPKIGEIHFARSSIYLKQTKINKAKISLKSGLQLQPKNYRAIFQLGNIFLMEEKYDKAIDEFARATLIKPDFWQAINNQGLAYYEIDKLNKSIDFFTQAISLEENAEPLLALAACLKDNNHSDAINLAKKALKIDPKYSDYNYRKEQLWGEKIQKSTEELFKHKELINEIISAKAKIKESS